MKQTAGSVGATCDTKYPEVNRDSNNYSAYVCLHILEWLDELSFRFSAGKVEPPLTEHHTRDIPVHPNAEEQARRILLYYQGGCSVPKKPNKCTATRCATSRSHHVRSMREGLIDLSSASHFGCTKRRCYSYTSVCNQPRRASPF